MAKVSREINHELVAEAVRKVQAREKLTHRERAELKRAQDAKAERDFWELVKACPQRRYVQLTGRKTQQLKNAAAAWGIPCDGKVIDLGAVLTAFHDFVAAHAPKLAHGKDPHSRAAQLEEQGKEEDLALKRLKRQEREGELIPIDDLRQRMHWLRSQLAAVGKLLEKRHGRKTLKTYNDALVRIRRDLDGQK